MDEIQIGSQFKSNSYHTAELSEFGTRRLQKGTVVKCVAIEGETRLTFEIVTCCVSLFVGQTFTIETTSDGFRKFEPVQD